MVASPTLVNNYEVKDPDVVKFLIPMNFHNAGLRCRGYNSIADIKARPPVVAVPGRQVTNHMVLQWIGEHHLGNKNFFEDRIVVLKTQQMLQVIKSGSKEIDCVVWGSPLQNQLTEEDGLNLIVETDDVKFFPGFVNMVVVKKSWADANPKVAEAIIETIKEVNKKWNKDSYPYLKMYIEKSGIKGDPKKMTQWYKDSRMVGNTTVPAGLDRNLRFANEIGFVKQLGYKNLADLFWKPELLDKN
jgi:ABC-type nitrate/sulfonate/bicarbonate transport system substrate-binding protein